MRRVQNHFGIPSSSIAQSDIDERKHERIEEWMVETETIIEEEEEESLDSAGGNIRQTEPSRSGRQQGENSIQLPGSTHSGRQSPNHSRISNSSTPNGNKVSDTYGPLSWPRNREAIALYEFDGEQPGDLKFKKGDLITVTKKKTSTNDWWTGIIGGTSGARSGTFPANYVEMRTSSGEGPTMSLSSRKINFQGLDGFSGGRTFFLNIEGKDTIAKVKTEICLRTRCPKAALRLSWRGRVLKDRKTVDQCRIEDGDLIFVDCPRKKRVTKTSLLSGTKSVEARGTEVTPFPVLILERN